MEDRNERYYEALGHLATKRFQKVVFADLTDDSFDALVVGDFEWNKKKAEQPSRKISDWFAWFADSPLIHENDRERFKDYSNLENLIRVFEESNFAPPAFYYRKRFDESSPLYSTVSLTAVPKREENGHITALLFETNLTEDLQKYNDTLRSLEHKHVSANGKKTVLIVEDNDMNREILSGLLSDEYDVLQAENGAVGLEALQKHVADISVIVLDIQMPVMNGYEFLEAAQSDPFLSKIPILVATTEDDIEDERRCLALGASDFVPKPYHPDILLGRISNIIKLKESSATMTLLQTDQLTGLYTLQAFYYYARQMIDRNPDTNFSIVVLDVNRMKSINDTYGEQSGNEVLRQIASALRAGTTPLSIPARYGAARFLLLGKTPSIEEREGTLPALFEQIRSECAIKNITFKAGAYDDIDHSLPLSECVARAISALNSIERNYEDSVAHYNEAYMAKQRRLAAMEQEMQAALDAEQFSVYYQPKHNAVTGELIGAEALIRWIHPTLGFLSPGEFIPLFERNGFITQIDQYAWVRTCKNLRAWMDEGLSVVPVSVNASRKDFDRPELADMLERAASSASIPTSLMHIEVTESLFTNNMDAIERILERCRSAGFEIELDDFGTGYSSLATLASLPLDVLKLDMSFMRGFNDPKKQKILATCITLAKNLGMRTVAEGVENDEQRDCLCRLGCDAIQGYYFSKPLPEKEFKEYLRAHKAN